VSPDPHAIDHHPETETIFLRPRLFDYPTVEFDRPFLNESDAGLFFRTGNQNEQEMVAGQQVGCRLGLQCPSQRQDKSREQRRQVVSTKDIRPPRNGENGGVQANQNGYWYLGLVSDTDAQGQKTARQQGRTSHNGSEQVDSTPGPRKREYVWKDRYMILGSATGVP